MACDRLNEEDGNEASHISTAVNDVITGTRESKRTRRKEAFCKTVTLGSSRTIPVVGHSSDRESLGTFNPFIVKVTLKRPTEEPISLRSPLPPFLLTL